MTHTVLREREDGDFDHIRVSKDGSEELIRVVPASEKDTPFGKIPDDVMAMMMRSNRDSFLAETDWWANSDVSMTEAQRTYRQALRDITSHANWPHLEASDWPVKP